MLHIPLLLDTIMLVLFEILDVFTSTILTEPRVQIRYLTFRLSLAHSLPHPNGAYGIDTLHHDPARPIFASVAPQAEA